MRSRSAARPSGAPATRWTVGSVTSTASPTCAWSARRATSRSTDDVVVVDTDYTFVSGGARRNFTLRWTFKPVGSEWQADLAEAFPTARSTGA